MRLPFTQQYIELTEQEAENLRNRSRDDYTVEIHPPVDENLPSVLRNFTQSIYEPQTKHRILNTSPVTAFEIRRTRNDKVRIQISAPTKRLERKIRTHLTTEIPGLELTEGTTGLPVVEDDTVGGGLLKTGEPSYYSLQTDFDSPPTNHVVTALHRHAMQNTRFILQILFQPAVGKPWKDWWWKHRAYKQRNYLKKEKEKLWGSRKPTPREKKQAREVEDKVGEARYKTSIRFLIINAGEYTRSRVKELAGAFNVYENPLTGQYLDMVTVDAYRRKPFLEFASAVAERQFKGWSYSFQTTQRELAALVSVPDKDQRNLQRAKP